MPSFSANCLKKMPMSKSTSIVIAEEADPRAGLALFFKRKGGREAGDSAADDGDTWHRFGVHY
jgi:hypothetical protein